MTSDSTDTCIYCGCPLTASTRPAHVFPKALGGRLFSTITVCDDCNSAFANIEGQMSERLATIGAFRGALRGDRKPISAEVEYQGSRWHVENRRMDAKAPPPRDRGRVWPMGARREEQIVVCANALEHMGLPAEAMLDGRFRLESDADVPPIEPVQTEPVDDRLFLGDRISKRVMIKIAIELLAYFDSDAARSLELERVGRFARNDEGQEMDFRAGPDTETLGADLPHVDAASFHGIDVWTSGRKLHYRITLFSEMIWVGTCIESWNGRRFSGSYTFDITDPKRHTLGAEDRDGAVLVNKSQRVRRRENDSAAARIEAANFATAERRTARAPKPDFADLYPSVKP